MKQLQSKLWAKITALILLTIFAVALFFSAVGVAYLIDQGGYANPEGFVQDHIVGNAFYSYMNSAADYYTTYLQKQAGDSYATLDSYEQRFSRENSNFFFTVLDADGKTLFESPDQDTEWQYKQSQERYLSYNWRDIVEEDHVFASEADYHAYIDSLEAQNFNIYDTYITEYVSMDVSEAVSSDENPYLTPTALFSQGGKTETTATAAEPADAETETTTETTEAVAVPDDTSGTQHETGEVHAYISYQRFDYAHVTITGYIRTELAAKDAIYQEAYYTNLLLENRQLLIVVTAVLFVLCLVLFIYLLCAAGHKEGVEGIHLNWVDKIPLDLYLVVAILLGAGLFALGIDLSGASWWFMIVLIALLGAALVLLAMSVLMTLSTRFKSGAFWKNTVIYFCLRLLLRMLKAIKAGVSYCATHLHLYWQAGLIFAGVTLLEFLVVAAFGSESICVIWFLAKLVETPILVLILISLQKLKAGGEALAEGNLNASVDLRHMYGVLKHHGENLNSIAQGMQKAVQQQLKSERFRTDLITNVSHDIKTPLTSIVNYVDLLKKEDVQPEKAKEYIAVLDRQSARLKKLTEDLVEASKASSGTLPVHLEAVDVNVLLSQVSGEYQSRFELCKLEPIVKLSSEDPQILADGKLLWRVFDNLLSNICKYAMPGTRVYFTSEVQDGRVSISFKNISNYPLDITADELLERFVRGDSSRSTEGSGLGLSIAQSLTSLQKGTFDLVVDGDLFKANLSFPLLNA